jgi:methylmalonyl-CoA mutase
MTSEYGAESQLEKIEMLDVADFVVLNKFEKRGAVDALRAVRKQVRINKELWDLDDADLPVVATVASQFANPSVDNLWAKICQHEKVNSAAGGKLTFSLPVREIGATADEIQMNAAVVPPARALYLQEIAATIRDYHAESKDVQKQLQLVQHLTTASSHLAQADKPSSAVEEELKELKASVPSTATDLLHEYGTRAEAYRKGELVYHVRGKEIRQPTQTTSLSHSPIPRVALPASLEQDEGQLYNWLRSENQPGFFPFTAGVFPLKRTDEEPRRQFAGSPFSFVFLLFRFHTTETVLGLIGR